MFSQICGFCYLSSHLITQAEVGITILLCIGICVDLLYGVLRVVSYTLMGQSPVCSFVIPVWNYFVIYAPYTRTAQKSCRPLLFSFSLEDFSTYLHQDGKWLWIQWKTDRKEEENINL